jgi:hypothetical protein
MMNGSEIIDKKLGYRGINVNKRKIINISGRLSLELAAE